MEKLKCPCVNWYPESFLAGTRKMTDEEAGIYIRALCNQFVEGGIEPEEYKSFPAKVKRKFVKRGDLYVNERMEFEQQRKQKYSASRVNNRHYGGKTKEEWEAMSVEERMSLIGK